MYSNSPRCLMFYPWNLDEPSGALALLLAYSKALKNAGYRLDCFAPRSAPASIRNGLYHGVFENVFVTPDRRSETTRYLELAGSTCEDPLLPDKLGRDETAMAAAAALISISSYDIVGIHYTRCHSVKRMLPLGMPAVLFTHDLDALVRRQEEQIFAYPAEYSLEDEAARLKPFDLVTTVGPDDIEALRSVDPDLPVVEAPFTASIAKPATVREDSPGVMLWISSAAPFHRVSFHWFWNKVWPGIRSARPECRLVIAGRLSEAALQLGAGRDPQVSVLGVVEDVDCLYREADILLAPYYFGLGIKTKVIEALAKGIPVATTTLGIYNTHIEPGRDVVVADNASDYASQVIKLISCPAWRTEIGRNGQDYVRKFHDPNGALAAFVEAFDRVRKSGATAVNSRAGSLRDLHEPLRHLLPWTIHRCRQDGIRTVAIYGAGGHTRLLIPVWKALGGPAIEKIVVTGEPAEKVFMGFPVAGAADFDPRRVDAVILSSHGYEHDMARVCGERWPNLKVYSIWRPLNSSSAIPAENFESICQENVPAAVTSLRKSQGSFNARINSGCSRTVST
jgi:glycosyltransferase involved in cell wall biosynthesis